MRYLCVGGLVVKMRNYVKSQTLDCSYRHWDQRSFVLNVKEYKFMLPKAKGPTVLSIARYTYSQ